MLFMDVKLPQLGEGADSGSVVSILVKEGDQIEEGQTILELENEKAVAPIPASASGRVTKIRVKEGDKLSVGQVILTLDEAAQPEDSKKPEKKAPALKPPIKQADKAQGETEETSESEQAATRAEEPKGVEEKEPAPAESKPGIAPAASPSIRKIARELGIDLHGIRGSERGGRIVMADLRLYIQRLQKLATQPKSISQKPSGPAVTPVEQIDFSKWGKVTKKPFTPLRQTISRRLLENWNTVPQVTQLDEADITGLIELRKKFTPAYEAQKAHLTLTGFALKAVVSALKNHSIFNSSLDETAREIVSKEYYHIGLAVDTEAGLMVPVIRDVDKKSLLELSREVNSLAERARDRKITHDEMRGGTFTISNQGGIGGGHFTPIVNKPEVAILGLGRGAARAVIIDGKVECRFMLPICLSYDHRVIDGAQAARFTVDLVKAFQGFKEEEVKL
jgi:pyruvate dehydrogenase E2 component (dihydrolipoamide acetyltransferase)